MKYLFILLGFLSCTTVVSQSTVKKISNEELLSLVEKGEIQLVDVRTPAEIEKGFIENAIFIDYRSQNFTKDLSSLDKSKPLVLYCASGGRSARAQEQLMNLGFKEVYDLTGGFRGWKNSGLPVATKN